jgi:hypothetical protein
MKIARPLALVMLAATLAPAADGPDGEAYYALDEMDKQTYTVTGSKPSGEPFEGTAVITVPGTTTIDGKTYHKVVTKCEGLPWDEMPTYYNRLGEDGIYTRHDKSEEGKDVMGLPLPPKIGETWSYTTESEEVEGKILARMTVDIGDQRYKHCLKVRSTVTYEEGGTMRATSFYAPHIGLIKMTTENDNGFTVNWLLQQK